MIITGIISNFVHSYKEITLFVYSLHIVNFNFTLIYIW